MTSALHELGIDTMPVEQRIALVKDIWDSVAEEVRGLPPEAPQIAELLSRRSADELDPEATVSWEHVRQEAADRWRR